MKKNGKSTGQRMAGRRRENCFREKRFLEKTFIIDKDGFVVSHTVPGEAGKNYIQGGDEFAVFAADVENADCGAVRERIIKRLRDGISRIDIPELNGRKITVSVGTADAASQAALNAGPGASPDVDSGTAPGSSPGCSFEALYQQADREMYAEKRRKKEQHN